jgi:hypothetical protein
MIMSPKGDIIFVNNILNILKNQGFAASHRLARVLLYTGDGTRAAKKQLGGLIISWKYWVSSSAFSY